MKSLNYKKQYKTAEEIVEESKSKISKLIFCGFCKKVTRHEGLTCKRCE